MRSDHKNGKQYECKEDLKTGIMSVWNNIPISTIGNLYESMPKRCMSLVECKDRRLKY